jgi:thioredoxin-like negative regulator of GroEL
MKFNRVLPWYALLLIVMLSMAWSYREGFGTSSSRETSAQSFDSDVTGKSVSLVLFHIPSCGYCTQFMPVWDQFSKLYNETTKLDCSVPGADAICQKYGVMSYPTVILMNNGTASETYEGGRDLTSLQAYAKTNGLTTVSAS